MRLRDGRNIRWADFVRAHSSATYRHDRYLFTQYTFRHSAGRAAACRCGDPGGFAHGDQVVARLLGGAFLLLAARGAAENEIMALQPQQTGARIAIAGDQLVWWNRDRLEMWDLAKRRQDARITPTVYASALGVVAGEIIAVGGDPAMQFPWLTRFLRFHPDHVPAEHGYFFLGADRVVDAGAGEFWVSELPLGLVRYRLGERVEKSVAWNGA